MKKEISRQLEYYYNNKEVISDKKKEQYKLNGEEIQLYTTYIKLDKKIEKYKEKIEKYRVLILEEVISQVELKFGKLTDKEYMIKNISNIFILDNDWFEIIENYIENNYKQHTEEDKKRLKSVLDRIVNRSGYKRNRNSLLSITEKMNKSISDKEMGKEEYIKNNKRINVKDGK